jgi:hypothetical protein
MATILKKNPDATYPMPGFPISRIDLAPFDWDNWVYLEWITVDGTLTEDGWNNLGIILRTTGVISS